MTLAQDMFDLFVHRSDVYAEQWHDEREKRTGYRRMTTGTCPENPPCPKRTCPHIDAVPITVNTVQRHLKGDITVGLFQLDEDNSVKWGCIDVDIAKRAEGIDLEQQVQQQTLALARVLYKLIGKRFLVEASGSRGYHLWVFFTEPVQARFVLSLLDYAVSKVEPVDGITFEIYPKQTAMRSFGNLVKMPLGVHRKTGNRCLFVDTNFQPYTDQKKVVSSIERIHPTTLDTLLRKYDIDVVTTIRIDPEGITGKVGKTGLPCMTRIMREGLGEGVRDVGMFKLACFMQDRGLPMDAAGAALSVVNQKNKPPLDDETVRMKLESAYVTDYSAFPCSEPGLDSYCSSSCRFWLGKVQDRWTRYNRPAEQAVGKISRD